MAKEFAKKIFEGRKNAPKTGKKNWDSQDIEVLRLVLLLVMAKPSEERLEWVFNEIREMAKIAKTEVSCVDR